MDKLNVARATAAQALELQRCAALTAELYAACVLEAVGWTAHFVHQPVSAAGS
jgi:hypothetical protein